MLKVIYISYLAWNCDSFPIFCSYFAIIKQCIQRIFYFKFWFSIICIIVWIYLSLVSFKYQIATYHHTCPPLSSFTMNRCNIIRSTFQPAITILTEFKYHFKGRRVMIIKWKIFTYWSFVKMRYIIFSFRAQIVYSISIFVPFLEKSANV